MGDEPLEGIPGDEHEAVSSLHHVDRPPGGEPGPVWAGAGEGGPDGVVGGEPGGGGGGGVEAIGAVRRGRIYMQCTRKRLLMAS